MLSRVKDYLGIEGIRVEILLEDPIVRDSGRVRGRVKLTSHREQRIRALDVKLTERYRRGRGKEKLIDEYELGTLRLNIDAVVPAQKAVQVPFTLEFVTADSPIEAWAERNPLARPFSFLAKKVQGVDSRYFLRCEADVPGTALNPFDEREVQLA